MMPVDHGGYLKNLLLKEKWTWLMLVFVVVVYGYALAHTFQHAGETKGLEGESARQETFTRMNEQGEAWLQRMQKNPQELQTGALFIVLVLVSGLLLDCLFVLSAKEGIAWGLFRRRIMECGWGMMDVARVFIILLFTEILLSIILGAIGAWCNAAKEWDRYLLMLVTLLRNIVVFGYLVHLVMRRYGQTLAVIGIRLDALWKDVVTGLLGYLGFLPMYMGLLLLIMLALKVTRYEPPVQMVTQIVYDEKKTGALIAFGVFIAAVGPLLEEILFRGFVYPVFRAKWGRLRGAILISLLFAGLHAHWVALLPIFALSLMLCWLYEATASVIPCATLHMTHNMIALALLFKVKGTF